LLHIFGVYNRQQGSACRLEAELQDRNAFSVMPGVTVGENSIVGAHSFVNRDIPANCVALGVPARVVRRIGE
jgi:tetrahydrodipicolinate N-succinyltransferase